MGAAMNALTGLAGAIAFFTLTSSAVAATGAGAVTDYTITVQGLKQGMFKGEIALTGRKDAGDRSALIDVSYSIELARDASSGQAMGRRQHRPLVITKLVGASSPQYATAIIANEILPSVLVEVFAIDQKTGKLLPHYTIKLTDATVASITTRVGPPLAGAGAKHETKSDDGFYETIALNYRTIELHSPLGKTTAMDSLK
jgi:type VI secretion system secreted protein Hcp